MYPVAEKLTRSVLKQSAVVLLMGYFMGLSLRWGGEALRGGGQWGVGSVIDAVIFGDRFLGGLAGFGGGGVVVAFGVNHFDPEGFASAALAKLALDEDEGGVAASASGGLLAGHVLHDQLEFGEGSGLATGAEGNDREEGKG